jgi:CDP-glycerol glycerophosphotransferase (TagB/SpsB family)
MPTIFATNDIRLLKYCIQHKIPNVGMIKSWDNLIGKDPFLFWPDKLIVHNRFVEGYAVSMYDYPKERICIAGIPQMDVYAQTDFPLSRNEFFKKNGLDLNKKLIVYAAVGKLISYHEPEVIAFLSELVNSGDIKESTQLLVRLHPAYPSDEALIKHMPGVFFVRPGKAGAERNPLRFDFEFQEDETRELASTLAWADVLIQSGSTMAIDAACFDTPIISMGFDGYNEDVRMERSARRLLRKDHFKLILNTGGTRAVYTKGELIEAIEAYLHDSSIDHDGRTRIVQEQCYLLDGMAGKRIGDFVLKNLKMGFSKDMSYTA